LALKHFYGQDQDVNWKTDIPF